MQRATVYVEGMSCSGCEQAVKRALTAVPGVHSVTASMPDGMAQVEFEAPCTAEQLSAAVDASGYIACGVELMGSDARPAGAVRGAEAAAVGKGTCACAAAGQDSHGAAAVSTPAVPTRRPGTMDAVYLVIIAAGIFLIAQNLGINRFFQSIPTIDGAGLGSAALFGIGLLTSVHCIAMCGGINLAQGVAIAPASANAGVAADTAAASGEHPRRAAAAPRSPWARACATTPVAWSATRASAACWAPRARWCPSRSACARSSGSWPGRSWSSPGWA